MTRRWAIGFAHLASLTLTYLNNDLIIKLLFINLMMEDRIGRDCIICFEALEKEPYCMLDCAAGHLIHYSCICNWIKKGNQKCPIDRMEVKRCIGVGRIEVFMSPLAESERCFLCNEPCQGRESTSLKCNICKINPCHAVCLKEISTDMLGLDFNTRQVCDNCHYQVRQLEIYERMHMISLREEYVRLQRTKNKIHQRQAIILDTLERYENRTRMID